MASSLLPVARSVNTDLATKLVDVRPDGQAYNLRDGIIRARFRNSRSEPSLIEPDRVFEFVIDLWAASHLFKNGHILRVEISSSNFRLVRSGSKYGPAIGRDNRLEVARQTVYHSANHPSYIVLPIISR